jgi:hypothetical protein
MDPDYIYATASQIGIKDPNRVSILENVITRLQQAERENVPAEGALAWIHTPPSSSLDPKGEAGSKKSPMWLLPHHAKQAASSKSKTGGPTSEMRVQVPPRFINNTPTPHMNIKDEIKAEWEFHKRNPELILLFLLLIAGFLYLSLTQ